MLRFFYVIFLPTLLLSCSSTNSKNNDAFSKAQTKFFEVFPDQYPPLEVKQPLSTKHRTAIKNMLDAVSDYLSEINVKHAYSSESLEVIISPKGNSELNKIAQKLSAEGITFKYDGLYFAKNPFSAGTFNEKKRIMLISHTALLNEERRRDVIGHELVHVETYRKKLKKLPYPFYCKFKGTQFGPHYFPCDEMNAYNQDLKRLLSSNGSKELLKKKVKHARMHTDPVLKLIDGLKINTSKSKDGYIFVQGSNKKGSYYIEFPIFAVFSGKKSPKQVAIDFLNRLKTKNREFSNFISEVESSL